MKLYTKTGDDGSTGLIGGGRVAKYDARVAAYGDVDETNAAIGAAICDCRDDNIADALRTIQGDLFVLGAELAAPAPTTAPMQIGKDQIGRLERWIDAASSETSPLANFVLPGGSVLAARLHVARSVARRTERTVVSLAANGAVRNDAIVYLNRLSDLLFAYARLANRRAGVADVVWSAQDH